MGKLVSDLSVEDFAYLLAKRKEQLIYFWKDIQYEGSSKRNGVQIRKFRGSGRAMKRR